MRIDNNARAELNRLLCKAIAHANSDETPVRASDYARELAVTLRNLCNDPHGTHIGRAIRG